MAVASTPNFSSSVAPGLRKVWADTIDSPLEMRDLFNIINGIPGSQAGGPAGGNYFDDLQVSSLGTFDQKPEGNNITYDIPVEGNTVRYRPFTFGLGFRITEEMQEDDLYGVMAKMTRQLGQAAKHRIEVEAFRLLNNGFSTTGGTGHTAAGFDSLALFSTAHTLLNGGSIAIYDPITGSATSTRRNRADTDLDLSQTAIEQFVDIMEGWVNHSGMPMPCKGRKTLVIPFQLKWLAKELLLSELKPGSANNDVNSLQGEDITYKVVHYLTDIDSWFGLGPKGDHDLNVWVRRPPRFQMGDDFDSGDAKAKGTFRIASGHGEPDYTFGSQGA